MKIHPVFTSLLGYHVAVVVALITAPELADWARVTLTILAALAIPLFVGLILETSGLKLGRTNDEVVHGLLILPGLFLSATSLLVLITSLSPWALLGFVLATISYIYFFYFYHYREDDDEEEKQEQDATVGSTGATGSAENSATIQR